MCSSIAGFYTDFIQWKLVTGWNCNIWACYIEPQQRPLPWIWLVIAINTTSLNLCEAHMWGGTTRNKLVQQKSRFSGQIETPEYLTSPLTPLSHPFIPKGLFKVLVGICKFTSESILSPPLIWITTAGQGWLREAPDKKMPGLFGHCPNSDCTPPPSLKRALWGTLFPYRLEQMPFELQFSLHKCPKPSWQGFRPPKPSKCPFEHGQFFSK